MPAPPAYLEDPRDIARGHGLLVRPETTAEVAHILRVCAQARVGVVPYGGGTGLVGGQVAGDGPAPLILSLERMAAIRTVDTAAGILVAEAGAPLAKVQAAAGGAGQLFPLSLASEGTAHVGGILATNAGGVQVLRYGMARDLCLGVESVLPDGAIHHGLTGLRKDNTGYDLRHLLIGSEGTLAVITAASLRLFPRPAEQVTVLAPVVSPVAAISLLSRLQDETGGLLTAFELISGQGLHFLAKVMPRIRRIFDPAPDWMVLVEAGAGRDSGIEAAVSRGFMAGMDAGETLDVRVARSGRQRTDFWTLRESLPAANRVIGAVSSHDISVPINAVPEFVDRGADVIASLGPLRINCFGHLGDGNLHYNIFPPEGEAASIWLPLRGEVSEAIYQLVADLGGSISAEHGIGRFRRQVLARYADPAKLAAMRTIKAALDPAGIMNPGAVL
ncbi:MAG: FAD-binding oxidoreductase [Rhodobacteraceae bacterium]|nr:FAD-binding oxidoreductase [Paracoccaceae bacterium]